MCTYRKGLSKVYLHDYKKCQQKKLDETAYIRSLEKEEGKFDKEPRSYQTRLQFGMGTISPTGGGACLGLRERI